MASSLYSVAVSLPSGSVQRFVLLAVSTNHAIELVFYREGMHKIQPDRAQYSAVKYIV